MRVLQKRKEKTGDGELTRVYSYGEEIEGFPLFRGQSSNV